MAGIDPESHERAKRSFRKYLAKDILHKKLVKESEWKRESLIDLETEKTHFSASHGEIGPMASQITDKKAVSMSATVQFNPKALRVSWRFTGEGKRVYSNVVGKRHSEGAARR